jgi:hypothetical protein
MNMVGSFAQKSDSIVDEIMIPLPRTRAAVGGGRLGLRSSESEGWLAVNLTLVSLLSSLSLLPFSPLSRGGG